ncbi:BRCA1 BRCA2-containing complex, subunit 3 [Geranomyces variabilis]|uniref:BRCA1 BRCA2-containing complex, subunit 3 n=1 Tax=Geranomyces variabilis TaxID=109894 RepID=A0AAD5TPC9_9FUNG|nr:BRCA1 BRCA2-containing complex, subunit 3 [Geranomyces variabilis]
MALTAVYLSAEVNCVCQAYSLCTEKEETLLLLLGHYYEENGKSFARVVRPFICTRKDKRKDRVEISEEQLSAAITEAERSGTSVVGWSHSHPHITIFPSHVDLRTQKSLQMFDKRWFGLIFSVFDTDATGSERMQLTCFQTLSDGTRADIPVHVTPSSTFLTPHALHVLSNTLPQTLLGEERQVHDECVGTLDVSKGGLPSPQDILKQSYHGATYVRSMVMIQDRLITPLVRFCEDRHANNLKEIERLKKEVGES